METNFGQILCFTRALHQVQSGHCFFHEQNFENEQECRSEKNERWTNEMDRSGT